MSVPDPSLSLNSGLPKLGWSAYWAELARGAAGARPARVIREDRARCLVHTGEDAVHAGYAGALDPAPTTGDWVLLDPGGAIATVLPRRTALRRGAGKSEAKDQVLAANVDVVGVVHGLSAAPSLGRIERLTTLAWSSGAQPVVILTKADLATSPQSEREEVQAACPGAEVVCVSVDPAHPDHAGLGEIRRLLPAGTTGTFAGPSGVGKSSLVNALAGRDLLATGEIRADGKGRHTSVTRELVALPWGAVVIDTPGLRGVQLWDAEDGLDAAFADIAELAAQCRFADCQHRTEPGCAVLAAIADGSMSQRRLDSHDRLQREQNWLASRYDARLRAEQKAKWKALHKQMRGHNRQ
ncbi:MAG: GTPase EngC [Actinomycetia bacterium]|nr:GTPase EngC [Actinomycetes bacterium]